jgi:molybdenum cofactor biosynthesis enzyme MoaA
MISGFALNFAWLVTGGRKCVSFCCEALEGGIPAVGLGATGEETIRDFMRMREDALLEGRSPDVARTVTAGCLKCANYALKDWNDGDQIGYVNLSMYPAPCQSRCIYCGDLGVMEEEGVAEGYERIFEALDYAIRTGMVTQEASWQVSSGEIAIHPYRGRILDLVSDRRAMFYTNCFRFDYQIAANLEVNPLSGINLSIDSGTAETWRRIKGTDNFRKVVENLGKYCASSSRPGQITLKYIVLPGINDGQGDYEGVIALMKALGTGHLALARDSRTKYSKGPEAEAEAAKLIVAAGRLVAMLHEIGLTYDMLTFSPHERNMVIAAAANVIQQSRIGKG